MSDDKRAWGNCLVNGCILKLDCGDGWKNIKSKLTEHFTKVNFCNMKSDLIDLLKYFCILLFFKCIYYFACIDI